MSELKQGEVTEILREINRGDPAARDRLWSLLNEELREIAERHLRGSANRALVQTTMLVNEAFLRLAGQANWQGRLHFLAVAAQVIRRVLVDWMRHEQREKRGRGILHVAIADDVEAAPVPTLDLLALDEALVGLTAINERCALVVQLKFFAGLTIPEMADLMEVAPRTVNDDWQFARSWLHRELTKGTHD